MDDALLDKILHMQQFWVAFSFLGIAIWAAWYSWRRDRWKGRVLTPSQVQGLIDAGEDPLLWDSRKVAHRRRDPVTAKGALVMTLEQIPVTLRDKASHRRFQDLRDAQIVVFDNASDRATLVAKMLQDFGMRNVALMQGGLKAWRAAGLPTEPLDEESKA
jgi:rhodanese-related sulfurtransferase